MSGKLIKADSTTIYVKCTNVAKDHKQQDEICEKCKWCMHPGSIKKIEYDDGHDYADMWRKEYRSKGKSIYCKRC